MKNKVFEVVQKNFEVIKPGTWTNRAWILYDDRSVENTVKWHRESGYIYGVAPLEKISEIFIKLK